MRSLLRLAAIGIVAAPALAAQTAEQTPSQVVHAFHAALAAGDSATALSLLSPDVVIFESGGVEASRDEYRQQHLPADMQFATATTREITSERSGTSGDFAWVLTESRTTGTFRGRSIDSLGKETILLRRSAQGWQIVHIHWSSRSVRR